MYFFKKNKSKMGMISIAQFRQMRGPEGSGGGKHKEGNVQMGIAATLQQIMFTATTKQRDFKMRKSVLGE